MKFRQTPDLAENKKPWTYRLVQLADMLLNHNHNVTSVTPFTTQQRQAWDQMMSTLKELEACSSETKAIAFQHLLLLVGLHLFKVLWSIEKGVEPGVLRHCGAPPTRWLWGQWDMEVEVGFPKPTQSCMKVITQGEKLTHSIHVSTSQHPGLSLEACPVFAGTRSLALGHTSSG